MDKNMEPTDNPILHVCVVGFHHKKGCQLEYAYPPFVEGSSPDNNQLPEEWKHLPSMAIPDGAHNTDTDTIYFHLSALDGSRRTVFGISCYRQISAHSLVNRTADVTRGTVQKSVCVLSTLPLYGLIQAKLELITHAYFEELDFSKVELLEDTYKNLSQSINLSAIKGSQVFLGMSACDVVRKYRHSILVLFKLLLLERRVLFYMAPVEQLNNIMLGVVSLFPGMIECGLAEAAGQRSVYADDLSVQHYGSEEYLELAYVRDCPDIIKSHLVTSSVTSQRRSVTSPDIDTWASVERDEVEGASAGEQSPVKKRTSRDFASMDLNFSPKRESLSSPVSSSVTYIQPPSDHVVCEQPRSESRDQVRSRDQHHVVEYKTADPLADIEHLTSVSQVQNEPITEDQMPLEVTGMAAEDLAGTYFGGKPAENESETVHEVDHEECFSWEEDRLLLEIEEELVKERRTHGLVAKPRVDHVTRSRDSDHVVPRSRDLQRVDSDSGISTCSSKDKGVTDFGGNSMERHGGGSVTDGNGRSAIKGSPKREHVGVHVAHVDHHVTDHMADHVADHVTDHVTKDSPRSTNSMDEEKPGWETDECGFPLALFTKGSVCHPYLSLQYYSLLEDVNVRSFAIGATNILFKQKRLLTDAVVGDDESLIEIRDSELKKQLSLTTADLRFADYIVKNVCQESQDVFLDGTGWEGGEEWIRVQFRMYLMALLVTCKHGDDKLEEDFGSHFVHALKTTHHYKVWKHDPNVKLGEVEPGHPFSGQVSISDMKLRWLATMQNTNKGRKINAAVHNTGKAAVQAGKAVGGAISTARSAVSGWFTGWSAKERP